MVEENKHLAWISKSFACSVDMKLNSECTGSAGVPK